jgi:hypothetical protein
MWLRHGLALSTVAVAVLASPALAAGPSVSAIGTVESVRGADVEVRQAIAARPLDGLRIVSSEAHSSTGLDTTVRVRMRPSTSVAVAGGLRPGAVVAIVGRRAGDLVTATTVRDLRSVLRPARLHGKRPRVANRARPRLAPCLQATTYTPPAGTLEFRGCWGGPSVSASAATAGYVPDVGFCAVLCAKLTSVHASASAGGFQYDFPFSFSATGSDLRVGQEGAASVNVTPASPDPARSFQGGFGFSLGFNYQLCYPDPATFFLTTKCDNHDFNYGAESALNETTDAAPLPGQTLDVDHTACPGVSLAIPGQKLLDLGRLQICQSIVLTGAPFNARVSTPTGARATTTPLAFSGTAQPFTITPSSRKVTLRFDQFDYRPKIAYGALLSVEVLMAEVWKSPSLTLVKNDALELITTPFPAANTAFSEAFEHPQPKSHDVTFDVGQAGSGGGSGPGGSGSNSGGGLDDPQLRIVTANIFTNKVVVTGTLDRAIRGVLRVSFRMRVGKRLVTLSGRARPTAGKFVSFLALPKNAHPRRGRLVVRFMGGRKFHASKVTRQLRR